MKKKLQSVLLCFALCLSMVVPAFAAGEAITVTSASAGSTSVTLSITGLTSGNHYGSIWDITDSDNKTLLAIFEAEASAAGTWSGTVPVSVTLANDMNLQIGVTNGASASDALTTDYTVQGGSGGSSSGGSSGGSTANSITVTSPVNGTVTVNPTSASKGATVTVTVTPNSGYTVGTLTVLDADGNRIEVVQTSDTTYTFVMPDSKVTVNATFVLDGEAPFVDISRDDYFYDAVLWAVAQGITTGDGVNTFGPNKSCTRAQMVTFLWRAAGSPAAEGDNPFTDVAAGEYYTDAVLWAVEKGVTTGVGDDLFAPDATVTRGQTVTFLYRYAGSPAVSGGDPFGDVAATDYFADAVQWAVAEGITYGDGVNTFSPEKDCTRGQIVTFMYRQMAE